MKMPENLLRDFPQMIPAKRGKGRFICVSFYVVSG